MAIAQDVLADALDAMGAQEDVSPPEPEPTGEPTPAPPEDAPDETPAEPAEGEATELAADPDEAVLAALETLREQRPEIYAQLERASAQPEVKAQAAPDPVALAEDEQESAHEFETKLMEAEVAREALVPQFEGALAEWRAAYADYQAVVEESGAESRSAQTAAQFVRQAKAKHDQIGGAITQRTNEIRVHALIDKVLARSPILRKDPSGYAALVLQGAITLNLPLREQERILNQARVAHWRKPPIIAPGKAAPDRSRELLGKMQLKIGGGQAGPPAKNGKLAGVARPKAMAAASKVNGVPDNFWDSKNW